MNTHTPTPDITLAVQHIYHAGRQVNEGIEVFTRLVGGDGSILPPLPKLTAGRWAAIDLLVARLLIDLLSRGLFITYSGYMNVNISAETLDNRFVMKQLIPLYAELNELTHQQLNIEISESADDFSIERHWKELAGAASAIVMDDYGKDNATPARLKRFDFNACKFDNLQVAEKEAFRSAITEKQRVIVEGIETHDEMVACCALGYSSQQGFFHHRPAVIPPSVFTQ